MFVVALDSLLGVCDEVAVVVPEDGVTRATEMLQRGTDCPSLDFRERTRRPRRRRRPAETGFGRTGTRGALR